MAREKKSLHPVSYTLCGSVINIISSNFLSEWYRFQYFLINCKRPWPILARAAVVLIFSFLHESVYRRRQCRISKFLKFPVFQILCRTAFPQSAAALLQLYLPTALRCRRP